MAMITDRDLAIVEPSIFIDAGSQATLLYGASNGAIATNTRFTSVGSDFAGKGIDLGHIITVDTPSQVLEVTGPQSTDTVLVSRLRVDSTDPAITLDNATGLTFSIYTFERAIDRAESWVLGALGIGDTGSPDDLDETAITNPQDVGRLIALRTIARVLASASALDPTSDSLTQRAAVYAARAEEATHQTVVRIDLDGDGLPEATRRIDVLALVRD
ncbi:MAG: hypothetical protein IH830_07335 [Planctomycetes bacterium]|nr:hypothetical protein [Planctomycetota bacterium]